MTNMAESETTKHKEKAQRHIVEIKSSYDRLSKIIIPFLGVVAATGVVWMTLKQFETQTQLLKCQSRQIVAQSENTRKLISAEQFKNAVEHLGNDKQTVVLGGVLALHDLAVKFPEEYSRQAFEVLCSFIRETMEPAYQKTLQADIRRTSLPTDDSLHQATSLTVIQAIVDQLFRGEKSKEVYQYNASFSKTLLEGVDWSGANLPRANLQLTYLHDVNLRGVDLQGAHLHGTGFRYADLRGAKLQGAKLAEADLRFAKLQGANLSGTHLCDKAWEVPWANLQHANLQGANLSGAQFMENMPSECLQGADLRATDRSGILFYDDDGNEHDHTMEWKIKWFRERGAFVDGLPIE